MSAIQSISLRQQRARYLILSAAVPVAWARAKAHGTVDAIEVRDEWMQHLGTTAPGAAHPTHTLRLSPELMEHGFTDVKPAPGDPTFTALWDALSLDGDLVALIETHGRDASITEWITCLTAEPQVAAVAFEGPGSFQQMLQWPLRIGISANADGAALRTLLEGGHFSELYTLADADAMEVDLWLATESLEDAAAAARPECAALLVLGQAGPETSPVKWGSLQWQANVAALAACALAREGLGPWVHAAVGVMGPAPPRA
ncbi:MAG: hypothetical protein K0M70_10840, partial [Arenimonas sp.]|uniref:hypothetical protein n=1 Tax=Arenimonas sp. TaxID=1872635 RepID=UPI0025C36371